MSNCHPLNVVGRGSETQLWVAVHLNKITYFLHERVQTIITCRLHLRCSGRNICYSQDNNCYLCILLISIQINSKGSSKRQTAILPSIQALFGHKCKRH